jgi:hypothetical protein
LTAGIRILLLLFLVEVHNTFILDVLEDDGRELVVLECFGKLLNALVLTLEVNEELLQVVHIVEDKVVDGDGVLLLHVVSPLGSHGIVDVTLDHIPLVIAIHVEVGAF